MGRKGETGERAVFDWTAGSGAPGPRPFGMVRVRTLAALRWLAVAGQAAAVLVVQFGLNFDAPFLAVWLAVGASVFLNLGLIATRRMDRLARPREAAAQLAFDIVQLTVLTGLTGGLDNPFVMLLVAPVAIAASVLPRQYALALGALATLCASVLMVASLPLPWMDRTLAFPVLYHAGVLVALAIAIAFAGFTASRGAVEAAHISAALAATQTVLAREEQLAAVGALAAAAAHELGTPLATIQLTAKEMARALPGETPLAADARLLVEQAERCRDILTRLSRGGLEDTATRRAELTVLLEEAAAPLRGLGPEIAIGAEGEGRAPVVLRAPETLFVLETLLENAVDFAKSEVRATAYWDARQIRVAIDDDGPGFRADILPALGEPYVTTRRGGDEGAGGLGLGVFIARNLIARVGGEIAFGNRPEGGARAVAIWPRERISGEKPAMTGPRET